jgi:hypothetical protein
MGVKDKQWKQKTGPIMISARLLIRNERWITSCEGMERDGISLGSMENGLYSRKEKDGMFLLQKS